MPTVGEKGTLRARGHVDETQNDPAGVGRVVVVRELVAGEGFEPPTFGL